MKIDAKHIAKLANIPITKDEKQKLEKDLTETLDYIGQLNSIDTSNIKPTNQVTNLENVFREDEATPSLSQDEALKNSKSTNNGLFRVKAILTE